MGLTAVDRPVPAAGAAAWSARTAASPRATSEPSTAPSAGCGCSAADPRTSRLQCRSTTTPAPPATIARTSFTGSTIPARSSARRASRRGRCEAVRAAGDPLQGVRLGEEGPRRVQHGARRRRAVRLEGDGKGGVEGRTTSGARRRRRTGRARRAHSSSLGRSRSPPHRPPRPRPPLLGRTEPRCLPPPTGSRSPRPPRSWRAANIQFRPETIGTWARSGRLSSIKLGGRRFVRRGEVGRSRRAAPRPGGGPAAGPVRGSGLTP